ncbi:hypothetical protein M422DRAFT_174831 [Sphaerobolus stellatus SS14]|uniref:Uncharacterized protein n=1 Tax=Sphaerobolus stellatus (strain SS14) TaxID=990650 RepID=A0A0C9UXP2_SPHS4|nr:hypothetical protein M422DRAFT_174831 [Sphaerobolus stellatus SS14]
MILDDEYGNEGYIAGSSSSHVPNPAGKNQYSNCSPTDDQEVTRILSEYDHKGIKDPKHIKRMLAAEHGIQMS